MLSPPRGQWVRPSIATPASLRRFSQTCRSSVAIEKATAPAHARRAAEWCRREDARFAASGRAETTAARRDDRHRKRKAADRDKCCSGPEPVHRTDRRARMPRRRELFPTRRGERAFAVSVSPCGRIRRRRREEIIQAIPRPERFRAPAWSPAGSRRWPRPPRGAAHMLRDCARYNRGRRDNSPSSHKIV